MVLSRTFLTGEQCVPRIALSLCLSYFAVWNVNGTILDHEVEVSCGRAPKQMECHTCLAGLFPEKESGLG